MDITASNLTIEAVHAVLQEMQTRKAEEQRRHEAAAKIEREKLYQSFLKEEVAPDAMERLALMVRRAVARGEKQVLVFQFPSAWLPDHGRAITSQAEDWHQRLDGFAQRAYAFFERELKPRGFQVRAEILDWPDGLPGDVGFFLQWKRPDDV